MLYIGCSACTVGNDRQQAAGGHSRAVAVSLGAMATADKKKLVVEMHLHCQNQLLQVG
jgi:hypothetical protein